MEAALVQSQKHCVTAKTQVEVDVTGAGQQRGHACPTEVAGSEFGEQQVEDPPKEIVDLEVGLQEVPENPAEPNASEVEEPLTEAETMCYASPVSSGSEDKSPCPDKSWIQPQERHFFPQNGYWQMPMDYGTGSSGSRPSMSTEEPAMEEEPPETAGSTATPATEEERSETAGITPGSTSTPATEEERTETAGITSTPEPAGEEAALPLSHERNNECRDWQNPEYGGLFSSRRDMQRLVFNRKRKRGGAKAKEWKEWNRNRDWNHDEDWW